MEVGSQHHALAVYPTMKEPFLFNLFEVLTFNFPATIILL
jgi:hypothetical protein